MSSEEKKSIRSEIKDLDGRFPEHFAQQYKDDPKFIGCPYHAALEAAASSKKSNSEDSFVDELEKKAGALD